MRDVEHPVLGAHRAVCRLAEELRHQPGVHRLRVVSGRRLDGDARPGDRAGSAERDDAVEHCSGGDEDPDAAGLLAREDGDRLGGFRGEAGHARAHRHPPGGRRDTKAAVCGDRGPEVRSLALASRRFEDLLHEGALLDGLDPHRASRSRRASTREQTPEGHRRHRIMAYPRLRR